MIALTGGMLGVLMMVPLRRYLIVKEHGVLRYPEGKACAEILIAGEKGGMSARKVFAGMAVTLAVKMRDCPAYAGMLEEVRPIVRFKLALTEKEDVAAAFPTPFTSDTAPWLMVTV